MKRRLVGVVGAVMLALVGVFMLTAYVNAAEDRALAGERTVEVLVVNKAVPAGTSAEDMAKLVTRERVPAKVRAKDAVAELKTLGEKVASADLSPGEQVVAGRFVEASDFQMVGQADVPDGSFQVTVALAPERGVGGLITPGATVGVLASFESFDVSSTDPVELDGTVVPPGGQSPNSTEMILHKVLVTQVQRSDDVASNEDDANQAPSGNLLVTLALESAHDVERVIFTAEHGTLWLAFEPKDAPEDDGPVVTRVEVYR